MRSLMIILLSDRCILRQRMSVNDIDEDPI